MTTTQYCTDCKWRTTHVDGACIVCYPPDEREKPEPRDPETVDLFDRPEAA